MDWYRRDGQEPLDGRRNTSRADKVSTPGGNSYTASARAIRTLRGLIIQCGNSPARVWARTPQVLGGSGQWNAMVPLTPQPFHTGGDRPHQSRRVYRDGAECALVSPVRMAAKLHRQPFQRLQVLPKVPLRPASYATTTIRVVHPLVPQLLSWFVLLAISGAF